MGDVCRTDLTRMKIGWVGVLLHVTEAFFSLIPLPLPMIQSRGLDLDRMTPRPGVAGYVRPHSFGASRIEGKKREKIICDDGAHLISFAFFPLALLAYCR